MYRATYPPIRVITSAQQTWNLRITSRRSSGSSVAARAVEPTRSQKRTVSWRLSASDCGRERAVAGAAAAGVAPDRAAIALRIRFRWPSATPHLSRSVSVTSGQTSRSPALSSTTFSYCPSTTSSSQFSIWSLTLTVACSPRHQKYCFPPLTRLVSLARLQHESGGRRLGCGRGGQEIGALPEPLHGDDAERVALEPGQKASRAERLLTLWGSCC